MPQTDGSNVFARCHLQIWSNLCFLRSTRDHNPNRKLISLAIFAQLTAENSYSLQWVPLSPKIGPSHGGSEPPRNQWFPRLSQMASRSVQWFFFQITAVSIYSTMGRLFSPWKLPLPMGGSGPPSNTWFPRPIRVRNPNGIWIDSDFLQGLGLLVWQTDRQTTLLGWKQQAACMYVVQAKRPNNNNKWSKIWHKAALLPYMDGSIIFTRWCQRALPSNTCFLGPSQVHNQNSISIGSAVLAGLTIMTDWQTLVLSVQLQITSMYVVWQFGLIKWSK